MIDIVKSVSAFSEFRKHGSLPWDPTNQSWSSKLQKNPVHPFTMPRHTGTVFDDTCKIWTYPLFCSHDNGSWFLHEPAHALAETGEPVALAPYYAASVTMLARSHELLFH